MAKDWKAALMSMWSGGPGMSEDPIAARNLEVAAMRSPIDITDTIDNIITTITITMIGLDRIQIKYFPWGQYVTTFLPLLYLAGGWLLGSDDFVTVEQAERVECQFQL